MSGVMIPWLWLLLVANSAFGIWGCLREDFNSKEFFPFGFFVLEGLVAIVWLVFLMLESVGAL